MFGTAISVPVPDLDRCDYLLMLGANPYASNGSLATAPDWPGRLEALRARGGRIIVVDPRRSRTAESADEWLADRLARPLVKVDLAAVVSKYIGETEKNLSQLLSRAEHLDAVLLFDEADSLFGARTDVKQANDRYANMQTNYLLQRLETFHGVAVLTTNSKARFDDAFLRRLDTVIEFPLPDVAERRALWSLHLGASPRLDPAVLNTVAALVDLPGGHIRNAVLTAALLARERRQCTRGDTESTEPTASDLQAEDLREALALEYRKLGQRPPDSL